MQLARFLLDEWLAHKFSADPPIEYDLGSSTGPVWTFRELLALEGGDPGRAARHRAELHESAAAPPNSARRSRGCRASSRRNPDCHRRRRGAAGAVLSRGGARGQCDLARPGIPRQHRARRIAGDRSAPLPPPRGERIRHRSRRDSRLADGNTRFLLVNSPHNPTGAVIGEQELEGCTISAPSAASGSSATRSTIRSTTARRGDRPRDCRTPRSSGISRRRSA